jgi:PAS domain S-box-containing protein
VHEHRGCGHDYRLMFSDGSIKHIHAVLEPVADRSGKVYEIVGTATDITEQIRAETELRRSEAYLPEAERISHTGCWARNPTSGALFWSQEKWRIFGLDPRKTKLSYELFLQMIHPDDRSYVEETSKRAVEEAKEYDIPFRIVLPDGSIKHIHSVGKPFFEENGKVTEYIGVSMDVTERKRDEEALRRSEGYLAEAQRLSHTGSFGWKPDSGEIVWSDETYRIFEYDPAVKPTIDSAVQRVHPYDRAPRTTGHRSRIPD